METGIKLYIFLVVYSLVAACNSDYPGHTTDERVEVRLQIDQTLHTRVNQTGDLWIENDELGFFMLNESQSLHEDFIVNGGYNLEYKMVAEHNGVLSPRPVSDTLFYPSNRNIDIVGYYPYVSGMTDFSVPLNTTDQTELGPLQLMYSKNVKGVNKNNILVFVRFDHAMSLVTFDLLPGVGVVSEDLKDAVLEVTQVYRTADFDLRDISWSKSGSQGILIANDKIDVNNGLLHGICVIPQRLVDSQLIITLADQSRFEYTFDPGTEWGMGEKHSYEITVNKTGIQVSPLQVNDWTGIGDAADEKSGTKIKYTPGDYYPYPDDPFSAIGMVFQITDNIGYEGKIVDLTFIQEYNIRWGDPTVDEHAEGVAGIRDMEDGEEGTRNLILKRKDQVGFAEIYQVFNWIYLTKNGGDLGGRWYLPSIVELQALYSLKDTWMQKVHLATGTQVPADIIYTTATESSANCNFFYWLNYGTLYNTYNDLGGLIGKDKRNNWQLSAVAVSKF